MGPSDNCYYSKVSWSALTVNMVMPQSFSWRTLMSTTSKPLVFQYTLYLEESNALGRMVGCPKKQQCPNRNEPLLVGQLLICGFGLLSWDLLELCGTLCEELYKRVSSKISPTILASMRTNLISGRWCKKPLRFELIYSKQEALQGQCSLVLLTVVWHQTQCSPVRPW